MLDSGGAEGEDTPLGLRLSTPCAPQAHLDIDPGQQLHATRATADELVVALVEEHHAPSGNVDWGAPRWQGGEGCEEVGPELMAEDVQSFVAQRGRDTFEAASTMAPTDDLRTRSILC